MKLLAHAARAAMVATSLSCAPSNELPPGEAVAREEAALGQNALQRGEMKRALMSISQPNMRLLPEDAWVRIAGAVGDSVEPEEVRDVDEFFQRLNFEDYQAFNLRGPQATLLGSVVSVAGTGQPHESVVNAFSPQQGALPSPGQALSLELLQDALREMGCDSLRPELLLYAAHQREVAANNNAALRAMPVGTTLDDVKGMTLVPSWLDSFTNEPTTIAWEESSWMVMHALDYPYRSEHPPLGANFDLGEIGELQVVTAAELGNYVEGFRRLQSYAEVMASKEVVSPPVAVWNEMLNPARDLGQRLRVLSSILDRIDQDGSLQLVELIREGKSAPSSIHYRLTRLSFEASLASWLYHGFDEGNVDEVMGWLFLESKDGCAAPRLDGYCLAPLDVILDRTKQKPIDWVVPSLIILDGAGKPTYLPFGHVETLEVSGSEIKLERTVSDTYRDMRVTPQLTHERPLAVTLPPLEQTANHDPKFVPLAEVEGDLVGLYEGALFRAGANATPYELSLEGVTAHAFTTLLRIDDRIYFLNHPSGILVYELEQDAWFHSETRLDITFWSGASFDGAVVSGIDQGLPQSLDLSVLPLDPLPFSKPAARREPACAHSPLRLGGPLVAQCDTCVGAVVEEDPYCARYAWDELCLAAMRHCDP
jgi:hypothetical protein